MDGTMTSEEANERLFQAAKNGNVNDAKAALTAGADPGARDRWKLTVLHRAARLGQAGVAQLLIENGADLNPTDGWGWTPLHLAAGQGHTELARLLIEHGANPNATDEFELTPLDWAEKNGHAELVAVLRDADEEQPRHAPAAARPLPRREPITPEEATANLFHAIMIGHARYAANAIRDGADVNGRDDRYQQTPLQAAAAAGYVGIVRLLLENGANIRATDKNGKMPADMAAINGHDSIVEMLTTAAQQQEGHAGRVVKRRTSCEPNVGG
jgi:ankyrin repeat protein